MSAIWKSKPSSARAWHSLDDIVASALAEVIEADAHFQLSQTQAWNEFSDNIKSLSDHPSLQMLDFSVGFGRLENLAINELSIDLALDRYQPNFFLRRWWGILKVIGKAPEASRTTQYRLSRRAAGAQNRIEFSIKVKRNEYGHWETEHQPDDDTPVAA